VEEEIDIDALMPAASYIAPYDPNVLYVHYEDAALQECLRAFGVDEAQRKAAADALFDLIAERAAMPGIGDDDAELVRKREWKKAINRLGTRHRIATELDASLPVAATEGPLEGARVACEAYTCRADGEGRRYAKAERWEDDDGKWRSATAQGMPGDLRTKLLGWKFADKDGRKSDLAIYVIVARCLGLLRSSVNMLIDEYLITDEVCKAWHDGVARHHGTSPEVVKRWPNILGNGGTYKTCLESAGLPLDSPRNARVEGIEAQLKSLRLAIMKASREKPNALWPGSEHFVNRHDARLQRDMPNLQLRERFNKVYSYLINTVEDRILAIHAQAQRAVRRDAIGHSEFDALPPDVRDTGVLSFDGLATERAGGDPEAGDRAAEAALVSAGWHAQSWGIAYKIVEKPMFGEQHIDPNEFESAKGARRALKEACAAYPEVQKAVDNPTMYRRRALPVANGNASVIPVSNGRALLTIEVRKGKEKYGLFGGKAEPGETLAQTAAREAFEESGNALSVASRTAISQLEPAAFKECRSVFMHVAVAPVGTEDAAAPTHFIEANANRPGSKTKHVGIEWVDIGKLLNYRWRTDNVHDHQRVMVVAMREALQKHVVSGGVVSGEKRGRDESSDFEDDDGFKEAMAGAEGGA
jgi:8-oxo-dGTP pyrophosphatase MutT (NUDIX family)